MDISQVATQSQITTNQNKPAPGNDEMGQDQFLQLLVTQMRNQDPLNPMDGKEMASQLAQFNSVEQLIGVNKGLTSLQNSQEMMRVELTNSMAASLTGKQVRALTDQVKLEAGESVDINYELNNPAEEVEIIVKDSNGSTVRKETLNSGSEGKNSWSWDGKTNDGIPAPEGQYTVEINASNGESAVKSRMFTEGVANRVRFSGDGVYISIDGLEVPIGNIESVGINENS